jgi:hypothetical protein
MDRQILSALFDAVGGGLVGSLSTAALVLYRDRRNQERETGSVATALLWEIDYFYKIYIRNPCRALKNASPSNLSFYVKPLDFAGFAVFEATADKVGLFDPALVREIVGFYSMARSLLDTFRDYRDTLEQLQAGQQLNSKAISLLGQIKEISADMVPLAKTICELLAARAKLHYTFDVP